MARGTVTVTLRAEVTRTDRKVAVSFFANERMIERRGVVADTVEDAVKAETELRGALATLGYDFGG